MARRLTATILIAATGALALTGCGSSHHTQRTRTVPAKHPITMPKGAPRSGQPVAPTSSRDLGIDLRGRTSLKVTYDPTSQQPAGARTWTLTCAPTGGSHPDAAAACAEIVKSGRVLFGPVPGRMHCDALAADGPVATVSGVIAGEPVSYTTDGICDPVWDYLPALLRGSAK